jgi:hypothetical protein
MKKESIIELYKDSILVSVGLTLATWIAIAALYFIGACFTYSLFVTMLLALIGYLIVFTGVSTIVVIMYWLNSKLYKKR